MPCPYSEVSSDFPEPSVQVCHWRSFLILTSSVIFYKQTHVKMLYMLRSGANLNESMIQLNSLHPNIIVHILHTVPSIIPKVLTGRICLTIKSLFRWWSFSLFLRPLCVIQGGYCKEKLDASHSWGAKG